MTDNTGTSGNLKRSAGSKQTERKKVTIKKKNLFFIFLFVYTLGLTAGNHSCLAEDKGLALVLCLEICCVTESDHAFFGEGGEAS